MNVQRAKARVRVRRVSDPKKMVLRYGLIPAMAVAVLLLLLLSASVARAQFPRLGLTASADHYEETIDVVLDEEFDLYICVFGVDDDTDLDQEFSSISWVLHQVCCGATLVIDSVDFNPDFQNEGMPYLGVTSTSEVCVDEPLIWLATLHSTMIADEDGAYLVAAGPYEQAIDCEDENPLVMGLPMTINLSGVSTPVEGLAWDRLKSVYR